MPSNSTRPSSLSSLHRISSADPAACLLLGSSNQPHRPTPVGRPLADATARQEVHTGTLRAPEPRESCIEVHPHSPYPHRLPAAAAEGGGGGGRVGCDWPLPHSRAAVSLTRFSAVLKPRDGPPRGWALWRPGTNTSPRNAEEVTTSAHERHPQRTRSNAKLAT